MKRAIIRADASSTIGSGHIMRCLPLAKALSQQGVCIDFVCRQILPNMVERIRASGYGLHLLKPLLNEPLNREEHSSWLGLPWQEDADECATFLAQQGDCDWLIVDHYGIDARWHAALRPHTKNILVLDDLADRDYDCDILVDANLPPSPPKPYDEHLPSSSLLLQGPRYALLRDEWAQMRCQSVRDEYTVQHTPPRVLISYGGTDPTGETLKVLKTLQRLGREVKVDCVIGNGVANREAIVSLVDSQNWQCHIDIDYMAQLASECDLAFGAAGVSSMERCCVGLPTILTICGANQTAGAIALETAGAAVNLGSYETVTVERLTEACLRLLDQPKTLHAMRQKANELCDGRGVARVVQRMQAFAVTLRLATEADCDAVWAWRNDPRNRQYSLDANEIPLQQHRDWFAKTLQLPQRQLLIAEDARGSVGVLRFDQEDEFSACVSIYLHPDRHGEAKGSALLHAGEQWMVKQHSQIQRFNALVLAQNVASQKLFIEMGYRLVSQDGQSLHMTKAVSRHDNKIQGRQE